MKKTGLIGIIVVLTIVGFLFFFGQNSGQRVKIIGEGTGAGVPARDPRRKGVSPVVVPGQGGHGALLGDVVPAVRR